jgi:hypothetical protein
MSVAFAASILAFVTLLMWGLYTLTFLLLIFFLVHSEGDDDFRIMGREDLPEIRMKANVQKKSPI